MLCFAVLALVSVATALPTIHMDPLTVEKFNSWKETHNKVYSSKEEEAIRFDIFLDNVKYIEEYNAGPDTEMTLGTNQFSDMTHEEFKDTMLVPMNQTSDLREWLEDQASTYIAPEGFEAPAAIDWRAKGAVTPVKNQGQCGSCYSFSATGSVEGQQFRKTNKLVSLSEQQVLDCSGSWGNLGCNGGWMTTSFKYLVSAGAQNLNQCYPYDGRVVSCRFKSTCVGAKLTGYTVVQKTEAALKSALGSVGPVAVAFDASHRSFMSYRSGIYYDKACSPNRLTHAVLATGYGTQGKWDFWTLKNSWGTGWGNQGYFNLIRNYYNHCGIANMASYAKV